MIDLEALMQNQALATRSISHRGSTYTLRLLEPRDAEAFGAYLKNLNRETRSFFGPHPHTDRAATEICAALDLRTFLRFVLIDTEGSIVGYFLLAPSVNQAEIGRFGARDIAISGETDCTFAPSLADSKQSRGLGSVVGRIVLDIACELGFSRVVLSGGVQARNARGVAFYTKIGFRKIGEFKTRNSEGIEILNFDMIHDSMCD